MPTRERLHRAIDELPEDELPAVERLIAERQAGIDPVLRALTNATDDAEALTAEEETAVQEGLAAIARGDVVPQPALRRAFGL